MSLSRQSSNQAHKKMRMHLNSAYASTGPCPLATSLHHGDNFLSTSLQFGIIEMEKQTNRGQCGNQEF